MQVWWHRWHWMGEAWTKKPRLALGVCTLQCAKDFICIIPLSPHWKPIHILTDGWGEIAIERSQVICSRSYPYLDSEPVTRPWQFHFGFYVLDHFPVKQRRGGEEQNLGGCLTVHSANIHSTRTCQALLSAGTILGSRDHQRIPVSLHMEFPFCLEGDGERKEEIDFAEWVGRFTV